MFLGSVDFAGHLGFAKTLYDTGRLPVPHFLFHALTVALFAAHLAPSLLVAGQLVVAGGYALTALLMYGLLWAIFRNTREGQPAILFLVGLTTLLAQPITGSNAYHLGYFWPEPYQIPTSTVLKPFALAGFACTAWYLSRRCRVSPLLITLFAVATVAGALSKPSFVICLIPAAGSLAAYRLWRRLPISTAGLLAGLFIPATAILIWQYDQSYSGNTAMYHDSISWAPLKFMNYWTTDLFSKFLLSILFPLMVTIVYWKQAIRDEMLQLAWVSFFFGAFYSYTLVETVNWSQGNFTWSGHITAFMLFIGSAVFWLRQISSAPTQGRALLTGAFLALHVISGARVDWLYLTHYGCPIDFRLADFVCRS